MASPKILIYSDEENIRESLKLMLADHYDLIVVDSGSMAIEALSHAKGIKIVLLYAHLPQPTGSDTLQEIRQEFPHLKVIPVDKPLKSQRILEEINKNL